MWTTTQFDHGDGDYSLLGQRNKTKRCPGGKIRQYNASDHACIDVVALSEVSPDEIPHLNKRKSLLPIQ